MEILITTTVGIVISTLIRAIQKRYAVSSRILLICFALIAWIGYQLFVTFVPVEIQQNIIQFIVAVIGTAVWVHEFLVRPILDQDPPSLDILKIHKLDPRDQIIAQEITHPEDEDEYDSEEEWWWAHEQENDDDWQFWEDTPWPAISVEDLPELTTTSQIEYHQTRERGKNTCTIVASAGAVGDLIHKRFEAEARKNTVATAEGYNEARGRYTDKAVRHVQLKTKEHLGQVVYYHKFPTSNTDLRRRLTEKWYRVVTWYRGNSWYNKDRDADGVVTWIHKPTTYSHLVRFRTIKKIIDNYFGRRYNVYDNETVDQMIKEGLLHKRAYVFYLPTPKIGKTIEQRRQAHKEYSERMKVNHDYMRIKWPIVQWPKWIDKKSTFQEKEGKEFVIYEGERHEIIKRR